MLDLRSPTLLDNSPTTIPRCLAFFLIFASVTVSGCSGVAAKAKATTSPPLSASTLSYQPIVEQFDIPSACNENGNTLAIASCFLIQATALDKEIDALQKSKFDAASSVADKRAVLNAAAAFVADRQKACAVKIRGRGSSGQISTAACLAEESKKRKLALSGGATSSPS